VRPIRYAAAIIGAFALSGCAVAPPTGPGVMALPGKDKSFEAFQADDAACREYASAQIGGASPAQAATESGVGSTVLGTVLGGAAGAAIGAATGNPAAGAAIGASAGLVTGGAAGLGAAQASGLSLQQRYDMGYLQCMSAKGENVPAASSSSYAGYSYYPPYYPYYRPYYPYYPPYYPYYPYYPPYYGPAFFGFGASFAFSNGGGHHGHHGHHFHGGHGGHNFQHGHH
jgi:outer membrane lipoprotein SlyB